MTEQQIENLEKMVHSSNQDDVLLAVRIIWDNRPFHKSRYLTGVAKSKIVRYSISWYKKKTYLGTTDDLFFHEVLNIKTKGMRIYKVDSTGKDRYLHIWTDEDILYQESGVVDTDNPVIHKKTCTPKNVGKSNETTGKEQAKLEKASLIKEKLREGYFKTLKEAQENKNTNEVILPMLAKTYKDHKDKIDWTNCYVQPKLDGMRCLAVIKNGVVKLISRQGKEITTVPHIVYELKKLKRNIILDGELYLHGVGFQNNMKLIKKNRPGETDKIKYHIYDTVSDSSFKDRNTNLETLQIDGIDNCEFVETFEITSEESIKHYHSQFLAEGYEGSIVRWGDAGYKIDGRSENLLKYKDFQDIALPIKNITPNEVNANHGTPWFELKGKKFKAGCKLSHEDREDLLTNKDKYIGKTAELRYFELSDEGTPRFPVMCGIRLDK